MTELMRIGFRSDGYHCWEDATKELLIANRGLRKNFQFPDTVKKIDVVIFTHPSSDRLNAVVRKAEDGPYLSVAVLSCGESTVSHDDFPSEGDNETTDLLRKMLKRHKIKVGRKLYVQIEY